LQRVTLASLSLHGQGDLSGIATSIFLLRSRACREMKIESVENGPFDWQTIRGPVRHRDVAAGSLFAQ
jgi:hypothetical protein